jgi:hypothetical protein
MPATIPLAASCPLQPPQRRIRCDQCWALPGRPCSVSGPAGDHLQRYVTAAKLGLIQRGGLTAIVAELTVIAGHVMIQERAA